MTANYPPLKAKPRAEQPVNPAPWYRWPEDERINRIAWFHIMRRMLIAPMLVVGIVLCLVSIWIGFGKSEALRFWRDL